MFRLILLAIVFASAVFAQSAWAAPVTNQDVVKLVKSGLSESTILLTVNSADATNFDTSAAALANLGTAGVPDSVVQAMIQRSSGGASRAAAPTSSAR